MILMNLFPFSNFEWVSHNYYCEDIVVILHFQIDVFDVTKRYSYLAYRKFEQIVNNHKPHRECSFVTIMRRRTKSDKNER